MSITFGIVTSGSNDEELNSVLDSILKLQINDYEILIVGKTNCNLARFAKIIDFDEEIKNGWITRKKNLITENSAKDWVVYLHDYFVFAPDWGRVFESSPRIADIYVPRIESLKGERFRDWLLWIDNGWFLDAFLEKSRRCLLPPYIKNLTKYQYISGGIWVAKRQFMLKNPLNESLVWGEAEDVEWSLRVRDFAKIQYLNKARVITLRDKSVSFRHIDPLTLLLCLLTAFIRKIRGK